MSVENLEFDIEEPRIPEHREISKVAEGSLNEEKVLTVTYTRFDSAHRVYRVNFDIEGGMNQYETFKQVAKNDVVRESDNIDVTYEDEEGNRQVDSLDFDADLPEDLHALDNAYVGFFSGYSSGLTTEDDGSLESFRMSVADGSKRYLDSDKLYDSLVNYVEELHPNDMISENAEEVADQIREMILDFEEQEIPENL